MSILVDKGESKKIDLFATGDLTSDEIRVYITKQSTTVDKYASTTIADYGALGPISYDSITKKTTVRLNIQASATADYDTGELNIVFWTSKTDASFPDGFVRMTRKESELTVQEVL